MPKRALAVAWCVAICAAPPPVVAQEPGEVFRDCEVCPQMVVVPAGSFMMGSPPSDPAAHRDERPRRRVTIGYPFAVGVYEVVLDEWDACVRSGGCDEYEPDGDGWGGGGLPVVNVGWEDAWRYADWLSAQTGEQYRLLSEAEWEYAARGGTASPRTLCDHAHLSEATAAHADCRDIPNRLPSHRPAVVGSYRPNGFGLHDMMGNVWEWVDDCYYGSYSGAPTDGSAWDGRSPGVKDCIYRVLRGGSWLNFPISLSSTARFRRWTPGRFDAGFRVARTIN